MDTLNLFVLLGGQSNAEDIKSVVDKLRAVSPTISSVNIYLLTTFFTERFATRIKKELRLLFHEIRSKVEIKRISSRDPLDIVVTLKSRGLRKAKEMNCAILDGGTSLIAYLLIRTLKPDKIFYQKKELNFKQFSSENKNANRDIERRS